MFGCGYGFHGNGKIRGSEKAKAEDQQASKAPNASMRTGAARSEFRSGKLTRRSTAQVPGSKILITLSVLLDNL
jgi:hypothetical protein